MFNAADFLPSDLHLRFFLGCVISAGGITGAVLQRKTMYCVSEESYSRLCVAVGVRKEQMKWISLVCVCVCGTSLRTTHLFIVRYVWIVFTKTKHFVWMPTSFAADKHFIVQVCRGFATEIPSLEPDWQIDLLYSALLEMHQLMVYISVIRNCRTEMPNEVLGNLKNGLYSLSTREYFKLFRSLFFNS